MRAYSIVIDDLKDCLEGKLNKKNSKVFFNLINELKNDFKKGISTKFLRGLMNNTFSNRAKTKRVNYLLNKSGLITSKILRDNFNEWTLNKYLADIIEYSFNKEGDVYIKDTRTQTIGNLLLKNKSEVITIINN